MEESAGPQQSGEPAKDRGHAGFARTALIAGALVAVVCIGLLVVIFFLDTFNATVYSVGGNDISGNTQEARDIRGVYDGARAGSIAVLVAALVTAAVAGVILYRGRNSVAAGGDTGDDVDFDDLGR
jgi:ABC-type Fe3+ transport system permease subunit